MGMVVVAHDPAIAAQAPVWHETGVRRLELDELLQESDVLSLHVPLTPGTRSLLDAKRLARMRPGAVLIHTARGGVVDETALAEALRSGRLAGAALDVFEQEPLGAGSALADVPGLLLTPHIAGLTRESNLRVSSLIAERVAAFLQS
jgi:(S)-sulfolactate dehydrogenase